MVALQIKIPYVQFYVNMELQYFKSYTNGCAKLLC
jgi:hypothetical protein